MLNASGCEMLYTGGCDKCYMQEVVIHVICRGCDTCYIQEEVVIHVKYRRCYIMQEVVIHVKCRRL